MRDVAQANDAGGRTTSDGDNVVAADAVDAADAAFNYVAVEKAQRGERAAGEEAIVAWATAFARAWNVHDAKALASSFADDASLSGASGRLAKGRTNIEKLFEEEHAAVMKATTFAWTATKITFLGQDAAMFDGDCEIVGMAGVDGKPAPPRRFRISAVLAKRGQSWAIQPCMFSPLPSLPAPARASATPDEKHR